MTRLRTLTVVALVAIGVPPQSAAADPPSATPLVSGPGVYLDDLQLEGASSSGVLFTRIHLGAAGDQFTGQLTARTSDGDVVTVGAEGGLMLPGPTGGGPSGLAGSMVVALSADTDDQQVIYRDLATDATGTAELPGDQTLLAATPTGWLVLVGGHVRAVNAETSATTDLGALPDLNSMEFIADVVSDSTGVVVSYPSEDDQWHAEYAAYADPGEFTALDIGDPADEFRCDSLTTGAAGCVEIDVDTGAHTLVRAPLDGGAATRTVRPDDVVATAVTPTSTAWITGAGKLAMMPAAGGTVTLSTATDFGGVAYTGSDLVVARGGPHHLSALRTVTGPADEGTVLVAPELSPAASQAVALGPGRVLWNDSTAANLPIWTRTTATGDTGLQLGDRTAVAAQSMGYGVTASGRRVAYFAPDAATAATEEPLGLLRLVTGTSTTTIAKDAEFAQAVGAPDLSGTRVLYRVASGWRLHDLATGTAATPSWLTQATAADLWGNYVAYANPDGSVWRKDLASAAAATKLADAPGGAVMVGGLMSWGDHVSWVTVNCQLDACTFIQFYRNARTGTPAVALPANSGLLSLGSDGAVIGTMAGEGITLVVRDLGTDAETPLTEAAADFPQAVVADAGIVAWLTAHGIAKVAALPSPAANPPRFLGNAISKVTRPSYAAFSWSGELVTSAVLTGCSVAIKSGSTLVRTLTCDSARMTDGTALVGWDGKSTGGALQPPGTYSWTLTASNGGGALLAANGTSGAVTGSFIVPAVKPVLTGHPAALTVYSGKVATFKAGAQGAPAPSVRWQVSANGGKTWSTMTGKTSPTLTFPAYRAQTGYRYRAVFSNAAGSATTASALLTVK